MQVEIMLITKLWRLLIVCLLGFVLLPVTYAQTGTVNTNADTAGTSQTGSLRQVINYINASGDATFGHPASDNTISITVAGPITLAADLPVVQKGVTITGISTTVSGGSGYRLFATYQSSLTLQNLNLQNGAAIGGNGATYQGGGGGGGLGAGGGVYIDLGKTLTLSNTTITGCGATGGAGGAFIGTSGSSGGGGASFSGLVTSNKNATTAVGGGDRPGTVPTGGATSQGTTGYGGGNGGGVGGGGGGGTSTGNNQGSNASTDVGGNGGYCGGGGGGAVSGDGGGGGGGNGGGNGVVGASTGGGGGGFGSGGAGAQVNSGSGGGGGGGGFGGGGGSGGRGTNSGSAGGGFGGGGGGYSAATAGQGGRFGGYISAANSGAGGGAGIGGAIFVGDGSFLHIGDTVSVSANTVTGGASNGGTVNGLGFAPDIFLFQGASLTFNGSSNLTTNFFIAGDNATTALSPLTPAISSSFYDAGVNINTSNNGIITYGTTNTYQGATTVTTGTLQSIGANLAPTSPITVVSAAGTFSLTSGTFPAVIMNNAGINNIGGTFAPATTSANSGTMNINSGGSFTQPASYTYTGTINVNTGTTPLANALTGTAASILNIGNANAVTYTTGFPISVPTINVQTSGTNFTIATALTIATAFTTAAGTTTNVNVAYSNAAPVSNAGTMTISNAFGSGLITNASTGILNLASGANIISSNIINNLSGQINVNSAATVSGTITNNGTMSIAASLTSSNTIANNNLTNITAAFAPFTGSSNLGTMNINSGGSFTEPASYIYTGTINVNTGTSPLANALVGNAGSILNIGNANPVTYTNTGITITGVVSINVQTSGTTFNIEDTLSGITTAFSTYVGATTNVNYPYSNTGRVANAGTMTINNAFGSGTITNESTGMLYLASGAVPIISSNIINNASGNVFVNSQTNATGTITNSGIMTVAAELDGNGTINSSGTLKFNTGTINSATVSSSGIFNITDSVSTSGALSNSGTMTLSSGKTLTSTAAITNTGTLNLTSNIISMAGKTLTSTSPGKIYINNTNALTGNFTSSDAQYYTIHDATTSDQLNVTGAVNISNDIIYVTSNFTPVFGTPYSWTLLTATTTFTHTNTTVNLPSDALFTDWSAVYTPSSLVIEANTAFTFSAYPGINTIIAGVLDTMESGSKTSQQQALINAASSCTNVVQFNDFLHRLMPNNNANAVNIMLQNQVLNKVSSRIAAAHELIPPELLGFNSGDISPRAVLWQAALGSIAKQNTTQFNEGYRAKSLGYLLGIEVKGCEDGMLGAAFGYAYTRVIEASNSGFYNSINGYYAMLYGTFVTTGNYFFDWIVSGNNNSNKGSRSINVGTGNLSVTSSFRSGLGSFMIDGGKYFDLTECWRLAQINLFQYAYLDRPAYNENGSVAALRVYSSAHRNLATIGTGARLSLFKEDLWLGSCGELRAMITYDMVTPGDVVTANFLVGSVPFVVTSTAVRTAVIAGFDLAFRLYDHLQLKLSYDFERRSGYYNNAGTIRFIIF